jgi:SAM-dependent methyltransferase
MGLEEKRKHEKTKYIECLTEYPHEFCGNSGRRSYDIIFDWLNLNDKSSTIVDFGCGDNTYFTRLKWWQARGGYKIKTDIKECEVKTIGIDLVHPKADIICPMHKVPLADNTADIIVSFDALEHLLPEEVKEVFMEMKRISKPRGKFCFAISHRPSVIHTQAGENLHPTIKTRGWWRDTIKLFAKFDVEASSKGKLNHTGRFIVGEWNA